MNQELTGNLDAFRLFIVNLGGERYPALVKRWCNVLMGMWLLSPHAVLFTSPPRIYGIAIERFGTHANDHAIGAFMLWLAAASWALSAFPDSIQKRGLWWTACVSGVVWANIMWYLWTKWIARGGEFLPIHFLGAVPLFTSLFVPIRLSSLRRDETTLENITSRIVA